MRITNRMISNSMLATITRNRVLQADLQLDLATTKVLRKPSDDPSGSLQAEKFKTLISRNEQFSRNINQIRGFASTSSLALESITDLLEKTREIAVQGASDTLGANARASLATQVDQMIDDIIDLGNSKFGGRYVFAGTLTQGTEPFTRSGDVVTYNGNNKSIRGRIGFESDVAYNQTGVEVFNPTGGTDIFASLMNLKQGLENNDTNVIQAATGDFDNAFKQVTSISADLGVLQNKMSLTEELIENENVKYADFLSRIEDTDVAKAIVEAQNLEIAITTGLRTMAEVVQTSLVDFIS